MLQVLCLRTHLSTKNVFMEQIFVILVDILKFSDITFINQN